MAAEIGPAVAQLGSEAPHPHCTRRERGAWLPIDRHYRTDDPQRDMSTIHAESPLLQGEKLLRWTELRIKVMRSAGLIGRAGKETRSSRTFANSGTKMPINSKVDRRSDPWDCCLGAHDSCVMAWQNHPQPLPWYFPLPCLLSPSRTMCASKASDLQLLPEFHSHSIKPD